MTWFFDDFTYPDGNLALQGGWIKKAGFSNKTLLILSNTAIPDGVQSCTCYHALSPTLPEEPWRLTFTMNAPTPTNTQVTEIGFRNDALTQNMYTRVLRTSPNLAEVSWVDNLGVTTSVPNVPFTDGVDHEVVTEYDEDVLLILIDGVLVLTLPDPADTPSPDQVTLYAQCLGVGETFSIDNMLVEAVA